MGIDLCPKLLAAAIPCSDLGNLPEYRWDYTVCLSELLTSLTMMSSVFVHLLNVDGHYCCLCSMSNMNSVAVNFETSLRP